MSTLSGTTSKNLWPFTPQSIPGLTLWLDAADSSSLTISPFAWTDKSRQGNSPTATGTLYGGTPVLPSSTGTINGIQAVRFSSSLNNEMLTTMNYNSTAITNYAASFFLVVQLTSAAQGRLFGGTTSSFQCYTLSPYNPPCKIGIYTYGSPAEISSVANVSPSVPFILGFTVISGLVTGFLNGTAFAATSTVTSSSFTTVQWGGLGGNTPIDGNIGEILVFNSGLSTSQRQQVEGYLAQKWGLQANLPATHPYYATSTMQLYKQPVVQRAFSPVDISGCALWLDAADQQSMTFSSGTSVSVWKDKSGLANNAVQATTGYQPTYTTDAGYPAILFNSASTNYLDGGPLLTSTSFTWFTVFRTLTATTTQYIFLDYKRSGNQAFIQGNTDTSGNVTGYIFYGTTPSATYKAGTYAVGTNKTLLEIVDSPGNNTSNFFNTGSAVSTTFTNNGATPISTDPYGYILGAGKNPNVFLTNCLNGYIYEVVVFLSELSSSQRQQVESYLAWKWGLVSSLGTGHPGKLLPAFGTAFNPKLITGCTLWLDAADQQSLTISSGSVTAWNDKSGNGYNASGGVSPTYSSNGVQFNGSSYLTTSAPAGNNSATYFIVFKPSSIGFTVLLGGNALSTATLFVGSSTSFVLGDWNSNVATFTTSFSAGTTYLASGMASGGVLSVSINAGTMATGSATFSGSGTFTVGAGYTDNRAKYSGAINEIIVFNSALTTSQRQQVEGYLASKWGLQANLPATHAYNKIKP